MKLKKLNHDIRVGLDYLSIPSRENDIIKLLSFEEKIKEDGAKNVGKKSILEMYRQLIKISFFWKLSCLSAFLFLRFVVISSST